MNIRRKEHKWEVGQEVVERLYHGRYGRTTTIEKIYKTGNVILSDQPNQQYRPFSNNLFTAGRAHYSRKSYALLTDELKAKILEQDERDAVIAFKERFSLWISGAHLTPEEIETLRQMMERER